VIEVLCVYFLFVETKGPTLEEIAILFDGPNAAVADEPKMKSVLQEKADSEEATSSSGRGSDIKHSGVLIMLAARKEHSS
jgi:hypothetical protein